MLVADHLRSRHVELKNYDVYIDEYERVASFLLWDLGGSLTGYQQYRPDAGKEKKNSPKEGRYFTYKTSGRTALFGMETFDWSNELFIVEGIFDCVRIHNLGYAAIATLSNDPKFLKGWLWSLSRPIIAICDNDDAGRKMAKFAHRYAVCPPGHDLGSLPYGDVDKIITSTLLSVDHSE